MAATVVLIVPCYQAEHWLDAEEIIEWLKRDVDPQMLVRLLFVHECCSTTDRVPRKINRWLDHIAYSAPSRSTPGRVRIMHLRKRVGKTEALRQATVEALQWPDHLGGPPDLIGLWNADLAASAPFTGVASLALNLVRFPDAQFLLATGPASTSSSALASSALNALACLAVGIPRTKHATLSSRGALFLRVTRTLHAAVATRFRTPRLFTCELFARYAALHAGEPNRFASPLVCEAGTLEGWVFSDVEGNQDGVDYHGRLYDTSSISMLRSLHSLLMIRILYHWLDWPSGWIKLRSLIKLSLVVAVSLFDYRSACLIALFTLL